MTRLGGYTILRKKGEEVRVGVREIYVHYGEAMARSRLKIPAAKTGTARNINTIIRACGPRRCVMGAPQFPRGASRISPA